MDVDREKKAAGVGEKRSVREERDARRRERGTELGVVLLAHFFLDPSGVFMHFFCCCLFVRGGTNDSPGSLSALGNIRHDQREGNSIFKCET